MGLMTDRMAKNIMTTTITKKYEKKNKYDKKYDKKYNNKYETNMMTIMMHQGPDDRPNMELGFQEHFWRNGGATEQGFKYI